jgi:hypothetical protein
MNGALRLESGRASRAFARSHTETSMLRGNFANIRILRGETLELQPRQASV